MLTLSKPVHLSGPLHGRANLLQRYVKKQIRQRRVCGSSSTFGGKAA